MKFEVDKALELIRRTCGLWKVPQRVTSSPSDIASDACPTTQGLSQPFTLPALKWKLSSSATFYSPPRLTNSSRIKRKSAECAEVARCRSLYIGPWLVLKTFWAYFGNDDLVFTTILLFICHGYISKVRCFKTLMDDSYHIIRKYLSHRTVSDIYLELRCLDSLQITKFSIVVWTDNL